MGLAIYKDLPNNQAFVSVAYLQKMADENRIAVLNFPYSDPETVPRILPQHIRNDPYLIPRDTNAFLCQLLEVKRRELFPCLPYPMVKPRVSCSLKNDSIFDRKQRSKVLKEALLLLAWKHEQKMFQMEQKLFL